MTDCWGVQKNYLGFYTKQPRWTELSRMCYRRGCNCEGCIFKEFFSDKRQTCQMKAAVLESVRVFGAPFKRRDSIRW